VARRVVAPEIPAFAFPRVLAIRSCIPIELEGAFLIVPETIPRRFVEMGNRI
jgi:hypothetical protein